MATLDLLDRLFIFAALTYQIVLTVHFAMRMWYFETAIHYGWIIYALSIPAAMLSIAQLVGGKPWFFWLAGFLYLIWGTFGYVVEYVYYIEWRDPILWSIFGPYVLLFLATSMFYWWPLARLSWWLWGIFMVLYVIATMLNITSHRPPPGSARQTPPPSGSQP